MSTSESGALIATNAVFMGLAIASVALRLYTRQRKIDYLQADDFLILAALVRLKADPISLGLLTIFSSLQQH